MDNKFFRSDNRSSGYSVNSVFVARVRGSLWLGDLSDYEVAVRDLRAFTERVAPSVRVALWSDVDSAQIYSSLDERIPEARMVEMRPNARLSAQIADAEDVAAAEVPPLWVAILSKDWSSTGTEVGLSLLEAAIKNQLDLRTLEDFRDQGDRRHLQFRNAVVVRCETKFEVWSNLGCRATKGILNSILQRFFSYDQVDVSNLAWVKQIVHHIILDEHDIWKNAKHRYSGTEFVFNQVYAMPETATAVVFRLGYVQTQRRAAVKLVEAWRRCADLDNKKNAARWKSS